MENQERRKKILEMLKEATKPVTGTEMAQVCQVSRQIIVGDIALLRASGTPVISTPGATSCSRSVPTACRNPFCANMGRRKWRQN